MGSHHIVPIAHINRDVRYGVCRPDTGGDMDLSAVEGIGQKENVNKAIEVERCELTSPQS